MRAKVLTVERLERRELLAALWSSSVGEPAQAQECTQVQECVGECVDPVQEQTQTQDGTGPGPVQESVQTQTQIQEGCGGDCNSDCPSNDAAIESLVADDAEPLRERAGIPTQPDTGMCDRDRDGTSW
jgi:hypothetical protein